MYVDREHCIQTLRGLVPISRLGRVLVHEHIFCRVRDSQLNVAREFLRRELQRVADNGIGTIVDLTTYVLPDEFYEVATSISGLNIVCCAGYYLHSRIPSAYRNLPAEILCEKLSAKFSHGIGKWKVRPGIIKVATSGLSLTRFEREILHAAACAQKQLSVPIATHACRGGRGQLDELMRWGADPRRVFMSHLEMELKGNRARAFDDVSRDVLSILRDGAYVFFGDFTASDSEYRRSVIRLIQCAVEQGYLRQILLSTDSYWSCRDGVIKVRGSSLEAVKPRTYNYIFTVILPALRDAGMEKRHLIEILEKNPIRFFAPQCEMQVRDEFKQGSFPFYFQE